MLCERASPGRFLCLFAIEFILRLAFLCLFAIDVVLRFSRGFVDISLLCFLWGWFVSFRFRLCLLLRAARSFVFWAFSLFWGVTLFLTSLGVSLESTNQPINLTWLFLFEM